jgi:hypothetical protein
MNAVKAQIIELAKVEKPPEVPAGATPWRSTALSLREA